VEVPTGNYGYGTIRSMAALEGYNVLGTLTGDWSGNELAVRK
jgi:hypothetical protein